MYYDRDLRVVEQLTRLHWPVNRCKVGVTNCAKYRRGTKRVASTSWSINQGVGGGHSGEHHVDVGQTSVDDEMFLAGDCESFVFFVVYRNGFDVGDVGTATKREIQSR